MKGTDLKPKLPKTGRFRFLVFGLRLSHMSLHTEQECFVIIHIALAIKFGRYHTRISFTKATRGDGGPIL